MYNIRSCREWQRVNKLLLERAFPKIGVDDGSEGMNVLVFGDHRSGENNGELEQIVQLLKQLPGIQVVFKEKPRTIAMRDIFDEDYNSIPSSRLILWADVVISSLSGIVLDILHYKKTFLYLKYHGQNEIGSFENYNVGWKIHSKDELIQVVTQLSNQPDKKIYSEVDVERYLNDMIYGESSKQGTMQAYSRFYQLLNTSTA